MPCAWNDLFHHCENLIFSHVSLKLKQFSSGTGHKLKVFSSCSLFLVLEMNTILSVHTLIWSIYAKGRSIIIIISLLSCNKDIIILSGSLFLKNFILFLEDLNAFISCFHSNKLSMGFISILELSYLVLFLLNFSHVFVSELFHHHWVHQIVIISQNSKLSGGNI